MKNSDSNEETLCNLLSYYTNEYYRLKESGNIDIKHSRP